MEEDEKNVPLQPANEEAGMFFKVSAVKKEKKKSSKNFLRIQKKFTPLQPANEERKSEKERFKTLENKIKKSFGKAERFVTFATRNGRELSGAKEVEAKRIGR